MVSAVQQLADELVLKKPGCYTDSSRTLLSHPHLTVRYDYTRYLPVLYNEIVWLPFLFLTTSVVIEDP